MLRLLRSPSSMSTSASLGEVLRAEVGGLSDAEVAALETHYELLIRWNRKMNLTTVTSVEEVATRHYGESILLARHLTAGTVVDAGSGGGFPGIPVAIVRPDCDVTLVESHQRKAVFLREAVRGLLQFAGDRGPRRVNQGTLRLAGLAGSGSEGFNEVVHSGSLGVVDWRR